MPPCARTYWELADSWSGPRVPADPLGLVKLAPPETGTQGPDPTAPTLATWHPDLLCRHPGDLRLLPWPHWAAVTVAVTGGWVGVQRAPPPPLVLQTQLRVAGLCSSGCPLPLHPHPDSSASPTSPSPVLRGGPRAWPLAGNPWGCIGAVSAEQPPHPRSHPAHTQWVPATGAHGRWPTPRAWNLRDSPTSRPPPLHAPPGHAATPG